MKKDVRKLSLRRETLRELNPDSLSHVDGGVSSGTDVSNNCCNPTCVSITCQTHKCV